MDPADGPSGRDAPPGSAAGPTVDGDLDDPGHGSPRRGPHPRAWAHLDHGDGSNWPHGPARTPLGHREANSGPGSRILVGSSATPRTTDQAQVDVGDGPNGRDAVSPATWPWPRRPFALRTTGRGSSRSWHASVLIRDGGPWQRAVHAEEPLQGTTPRVPAAVPDLHGSRPGGAGGAPPPVRRLGVAVRGAPLRGVPAFTGGARPRRVPLARVAGGGVDDGSPAAGARRPHAPGAIALGERAPPPRQLLVARPPDPGRAGLRRRPASRPGDPGDPRDGTVRGRRHPLRTDDAPLVPRGPVGHLRPRARPSGRRTTRRGSTRLRPHSDPATHDPTRPRSRRRPGTPLP